MAKFISWSLAGLIAGYAIAVITGVLSPTYNNGDEFASGLGDSDLDERIIALENKLLAAQEERRELQSLVDELLLEQWSNVGMDTDSASASSGPTAARDERGNAGSNLTREERQAQFRGLAEERQATLAARRTQRLEQAGFAPEQASWILQREEEIRLENLSAQWEMRRQEFLEEGQASSNALREELGDDDYERYLQATGRRTSVYVGNVVANSQARAAGFQAGDEIIRYNGERVFSFNDLNMANVQGPLGEAVVVEILRDGVPMQLSLERGPLGIVGGRQRGNRRR